MKTIYHVVVETTANEEYESELETRYELELASERADVARPDNFSKSGDLCGRAGDIKTMRIDREMEVEQ